LHPARVSWRICRRAFGSTAALRGHQARQLPVLAFDLYLGAGSLLTLTHQLDPEWGSRDAGIRAGWEGILEGLTRASGEIGTVQFHQGGSAKPVGHEAEKARLTFITRAATLCLSAGRYSFPYRISSACPGKS
jgi:hypothetical protein